MAQKIFAGAKIRRLREGHGLTQAAFADRIGLSASYLNQIENNQRPLTAPVLLALAQGFSVDLSDFAQEESDRLIADLKEALADPVFCGLTPNRQDLKAIASNAPWLAHALLDLHGAYRRVNERLQMVDEAFAVGRGKNQDSEASLPYEEVRDFFHYQGNYLDVLDRAAESTAERKNLCEGDRYGQLAAYLLEEHGVKIALVEIEPGGQFLRKYDMSARILTLRAGLDPSEAAFLLAHQVGQLEQASAIETIVGTAEFRAIGAADITRIALGNYCAGALIMPYGRFLASAKSVRYDIERLGHLFGASVEQVCHRLSTLQRPGSRGVPFYFVRVDRAGNILKRHSATRFQFARFGGACPLWNVHEAFEAPGKILAQIAEMPDGIRYLCVARSSFKSGGGYRAPSRHFALGIGCEWTYADEVVYADGLDLKTAAIAEVGVSCRICERADCAQRAAPPIDRELKVDPNLRHYVPYRF